MNSLPQVNTVNTVLPPCPLSLYTVVCFGLKWSNSNGRSVKQKVCCCSDLVAPGDVAAIQRWGSPNRAHFAQQAHERWKRASRLRCSARSEGELTVCVGVTRTVRTHTDALALRRPAELPSNWSQNDLLKYAHSAHWLYISSWWGPAESVSVRCALWCKHVRTFRGKVDHFVPFFVFVSVNFSTASTFYIILLLTINSHYIPDEY